MRRISLLCLIVSCVAVQTRARAATEKDVTPPADAAPVQATIETSFKTALPQIRMLAFDGDPNTYFASSDNIAEGSVFRLVFDKPVALKSVEVLTGRVKGTDILDAGSLAVLPEGSQAFEDIEKFNAEGVVKADGKSRQIRAIRIQATEKREHPLAIREVTIVSDPPVAVFKHPVEVVIEYADVPEMKEWMEQSARINERAYQMICEELKSDGFKPRTVVPMAMKNDYKGVAVTYNSARIVGSPAYFKGHMKDFGAMVHEMCHVVQSYRGRNNPGWLVEGLADYIRNYKWEPNKPRKLKPEQAKFDGSYQITARFLAFLMEKYDSTIVNKLNAIMREGKYTEETFKTLTGKTAPELGEEWKKSLE